jgi:hypothetical protein
LLCLFWRWGLVNYLPWTSILQISASQVASITGVSHCRLAKSCQSYSESLFLFLFCAIGLSLHYCLP